MKIFLKLNFDDFPKSTLPDNAVKFVEANSKKTLYISYIKWVIIVAIIMEIIIHLICNIFHWNADIYEGVNYISIVLLIISIIPHEIIHLMGFGKGGFSNSTLYLGLVICAVHCTKPVSKRRFIFLSILPTLCFGVIPFAIWIIYIHNTDLGVILLKFSFYSILAGCGDFINIKNAITQMPKGSMQQLSGMNSYWYLADTTGEGEHQ